MSVNSWPWPDSLDAVIAAPRHHTLVFENEHMRLLDTRIPVGDVTPVHTHRWPGVYYTVRFSHFLRARPTGSVTTGMEPLKLSVIIRFFYF